MKTSLSLILNSIGICLSIFCCKHDNAALGPQGEIVSISPLWATSVNDGSLLAYGIYASVSTQDPVLTPGVIPYPAKEPFGRAVWVMRSINDGHSLWQWNDYMTDFENGYLDILCVSKNRLLYNNGPRTHCIDLNTGKTLWHKWKRDSLNSTLPVVAISDSYFFCGTSPSQVVKGQTESAVYRGSLLASTDEILVVKPELKREFNEPIGGAMGAVSLQVFTRQLDTLLVIDYQTPTAEARQNIVRSVFGVYNVTRKVWHYKDIPLVAPTYGSVVDGLPQIYNSRLYHSVGRSLTCHDLTTGKSMWENSFNGNFLFSGFLIADNILVANCEDGYIYGLDPETGNQLWKERSSGTSTRMHYQKGVVYYAGGGDGLLHAVDVQTGKHLWKLQSPDLKQDSRAFYNGMVAGIAGQGAEKGKIFVNTGLHIYAYEAAQ